MLHGCKILRQISNLPFEISHKILNPYTAKYALYEVLQFHELRTLGVMALRYDFHRISLTDCESSSIPYFSKRSFNTLLKFRFVNALEVYLCNFHSFTTVVQLRKYKLCTVRPIWRKPRPVNDFCGRLFCSVGSNLHLRLIFCSHNSFNYPRDCLGEKHGTGHSEISTENGTIHQQERVQAVWARY